MSLENTFNSPTPFEDNWEDQFCPSLLLGGYFRLSVSPDRRKITRLLRALSASVVNLRIGALLLIGFAKVLDELVQSRPDIRADRLSS